MVQAPVDRLFLSHVLRIKHLPEIFVLYCHSAQLTVAIILCIVLKEGERSTNTQMDRPQRQRWTVCVWFCVLKSVRKSR